jgi:diacylglycerol kinase
MRPRQAFHESNGLPVRNKFTGTGTPGYHPFRKAVTVLSGLRYAVIHDFSVAYKLVVSVVMLVVVLALRHWIDALLILLATGLVLVAEIFNTAIEALCDFVEERHNEKIKVIKDIAAAGVGISIFVWAIVLALEFSNVGVR